MKIDSLTLWWLIDHVACIANLCILYTNLYKFEYKHFYIHIIHICLHTLQAYVCQCSNAADNGNIDHACAQVCMLYTFRRCFSDQTTTAVFRVRSSSHTCRVHGNLVLNTLPNAPGCVYSGQSQWHYFIFWLYHPACNEIADCCCLALPIVWNVQHRGCILQPGAWKLLEIRISLDGSFVANKTCCQACRK